jgi:3D (Asp-Asp-Asp) domain-containing protein
LTKFISLRGGQRSALVPARQLGTKALGWLALGILLLALLGTAAARTTAARRAAAASAVYTVKATAYEAVAGQTDSKPFITADNSRIPRGYGSHTRWLALSRDLLRPWGGPFEFGDKVQVRGISPVLDGVYTVHDTMNRRYRHCLDVLVHPREHVSISQVGVKIQGVSTPQRHGTSSRPLLAHKAAKKPTLANRRTGTRRELAQHRAKSRTQNRAKYVAVAAAPHAAKRSAKQPSHHKHSVALTRQKRGVAKHPLTTLPKRSKKRVA